MILASSPACGNDCTRGSSALAASAAVLMVVIPCLNSTVAVVMMMNHCASSADAIPTSVSILMLRMNLRGSSGWPFLSEGILLATSSSTSSDACQKNIYGEIDVPKTPVMMKKKAKVGSICGTAVAYRISFHGCFTMNVVAGYESSASARNF